MLKGTIIEQSLDDKDMLSQVQITRTWREGDRVLHDVLVEQGRVPDLARCLADGPWYIHLWTPGEDEFLVLFKEKTFRVRRSDPGSLEDAVAYGKSRGIPEKELDFPTD
ncbi:MAG: hypothetical protein QOE22_445 [Candidatus Parcubacteria bacterium]|jgi:hypothetical protein|nr:hypothetical protein [Candidatus Parcubacteria bacterium]